MKKLSSTLPNMLLSLGGICVLVSGILAVVNKVTTAPIAEAETVSYTHLRAHET